MAVGGGVAALVMFHGLLVAALAGRLSRAVPLLAASPGALAAPVLLLGVLVPLGLVAAVVGAVVVAASRIPQVVAAMQTRRLEVVGPPWPWPLWSWSPGSRRPSSISWAVVSRSPTAAEADQPQPRI